ncbi:MAG TPA: hypothetical protein VGD55_01605, partial [Acidothermaceae bacterium]
MDTVANFLSSSCCDVWARVDGTSNVDGQSRSVLNGFEPVDLAVKQIVDAPCPGNKFSQRYFLNDDAREGDACTRESQYDGLLFANAV